jgi:hypothetical protein
LLGQSCICCTCGLTLRHKIPPCCPRKCLLLFASLFMPIALPIPPFFLMIKSHPHVFVQGNVTCSLYPEILRLASYNLINFSTPGKTNYTNITTPVVNYSTSGNSSEIFSNISCADNTSCFVHNNHSGWQDLFGWRNSSQMFQFLNSQNQTLPEPNASCNGLCPAGSYCPQGTTHPILCPAGTYLSNDSITYPGSYVCDCLMCWAGYFCTVGSTFPSPCPPGFFCPLAVEVNLSNPCNTSNTCGQYPMMKICPSGTYQPFERQSFADSCQVCGKRNENISYLGYYCPNAGASEQTPCPPGHFCVTGSPISFPCGGGTYRKVSGGYGNLSCSVCPASHYCLNGTVDPTPCPGGHFCKEGSSFPTICPGGFYCDLNSSVARPCPLGTFCLVGSWTPTVCPRGTYCVGQSVIPSLCPLGTYGNDSANLIRFSISSACVNCPRGSFGSDPARLQCEVCFAGYLCFGNTSMHLFGTTRGDPQDISKDGGQVCPAGFYCPSGAFESTPCPRGTYNAVPGSENLTSCVTCPLNFFNNRTGQAACQPCGSTSYSADDRTECLCKGSNRVFQPSDSACRCAFGYAIYDGNGNPTEEGYSDGVANCDVRTLVRCSPGDVRGQDGSCVQSCDDSSCPLPPCFCKAGSGVDYCNGTCPSFQTPQAQKIQVP